MIKGFIFGLSLGLAVIFTAHNIYQYQKAFDNCLQLVAEIHRGSSEFIGKLIKPTPATISYAIQH